MKGLIKCCWISAWLVVLISIDFVWAESPALPDKQELDPRIRCLDARPECFDPVSIEKHRLYLEKPVPKIVHLIWFGKRDRLDRLGTLPRWLEYCQKFKWKYMFWSESSEEAYKRFAKPRNVALIRHLLNRRIFCAASDVLRYEILKEYGGLYVDCDMQPPTYCGELVSLFECFPDTGLSVVTENTMRNTGTIGLFVANPFIFTPKQDPRIKAAVNQIYQNYMSFTAATHTNNPSYITGPFFFNSVLFGPFNTFSARYCHYWNIWARIPQPLKQTANPATKSASALLLAQICTD
ncbi:hypothetical protein NEHOM01_2122 [Nematocida homosporus]|uniref:uncharacterized protein n=1 Tax=Nematocida homosporus TaxID=1912981 RepID=UPI002220B8C5|nr:uncharacterized protein NEHOM01_2122 [Nematocida homosporus]KAI5187368.1 hypothetical protein NEHOM01_2122 [Nematocida homosporus]